MSIFVRPIVPLAKGWFVGCIAASCQNDAVAEVDQVHAVRIACILIPPCPNGLLHGCCFWLGSRTILQPETEEKKEEKTFLPNVQCGT